MLYKAEFLFLLRDSSKKTTDTLCKGVGKDLTQEPVTGGNIHSWVRSTCCVWD